MAKKYLKNEKVIVRAVTSDNLGLEKPLLNEKYDIEDIKVDFESALNEHLKGITTELTYSKVYGLLVNHVGVEDVTSFTINDNNINISIAEDKIINISEIILSEVV